jgi:hypothetical protein
MNAVRFGRSVLVLVILVGGLLACVGVPRGAVAQTTAGQQPGVVAMGMGRASGPADSAEVQVIVGRDFGGMVSGVEVPSEAAAVAGSPVPSGAGWQPAPVGMPPALTETDVAPIVDAIAGAGVPRAQIEVIIPAFTSMFSGPGGPGGAQLRFSLDHPTLDGLRALVRAVSDAASGVSLSLEHFGVHYVGGDCAALQQQAREAAVADARTRAEGLASALGVTLGELTQAADNLFYGPYGIGTAGGCGPSAPEDSGPYGPGMLPPFDAAVPAAAVAYAQVTLTFAMGPAATATPTS